MIDNIMQELFFKDGGEVHNQKVFLAYFQFLENTDYTGKEIINQLEKMSYYQDYLLIKHPRLAKSISELVKENVRFDSGHMRKNLKNFFEYEINHSPIDELEEINSSYLFFNIVKNSNKSLETAKILLQSTFAKKMEFTLEEINKCLRLADDFNFETKIQEIFPIYKNKKSIYSLDTYDNEVKIIGISNQCDWGSCWAYAGTKNTELIISKKYKSNIELSEDFTFINHLKNEYQIKVLEASSTDKSFFSDYIDEGANLTKYAVQIEREGVIPQMSWTPKKPINSDNKSFKRKIKRIFISLLRELKDIDNGFTYEETIKHRYLKMISDTIEAEYGILPKKFIFDGKKYTPKNFLTSLNPQHSTEIAWYYRSDIGLDEEKTLSSLEYKYIKNKKIIVETIHYDKENVPLKNFEEIIIDSIEKNRPVRAAFNWDNTYINNTNGVMSIPEGLKSPESDKLHAVLIIGHELDKNGKIKMLKLLNSHGDKTGDRGIFHSDRSFFEQNLEEIQIDKSHKLGVFYFPKALPIVSSFHYNSI